jgi:hypothetical protein
MAEINNENYWNGIISYTSSISAENAKNTASKGDDYCYILNVDDEGNATGFNASGGVVFDGEDLEENAPYAATELYNEFLRVSPEQTLNDKEAADFKVENTYKTGFLGEAAKNTASFKYINEYEGLNINWDYSQFFNDRDKWQKSSGDITSEPNWFYFKVFFDFNTATGLFGGIVNEKENNIRKISATSALGFYLQWAGHYMAENAKGRLVSLQKFVKTLNYVSNYAPWFFDSIEGLDSLKIDLNQPLKERVLKIKCRQDAIDMRLTTMFDLYKFACFDYVNFKEMLPENIRKFNMSILFFSVPIRYVDTHSKIGSKEYDVRTVKANDKGIDMMCKIINFKNCEFVVDDMFNTPTSMSNESPFGFSGGTISIKFQRYFEEIVNPYFNLRQSSFGVKSISSDVQDRLRAIGGVTNLISNTTGNKSSAFLNTLKSLLGIGTSGGKAKSALYAATSNALIDETEALCQNLYESVQASRGGTPELGNIYETETGEVSDYSPVNTYANHVITRTGQSLLEQIGSTTKSSVNKAIKTLFGINNGQSSGYENFKSAPTHVLKMAQKMRSGQEIKNFSVYDDTSLASPPTDASGHETAYPSKDGSARVVNYNFRRNNTTHWTNPRIVNGLPTVIQKNISETKKGFGVTVKTPNGRTKTI